MTESRKRAIDYSLKNPNSTQKYETEIIQAAYIHIPFCATICSYCDFCKFYYQKEMVDDYLKALQEEIISQYHGESLKTIYIGGGTPSVLSLEELTKLFEILSFLKKEEKYEYTIECNIENITEEKIILMRSYGINRISIGIQTFQEKYLSFLNRHHTKQEAIDKLKMVQKYIKNINVDFMYAFPSETLEELESDLDELLSFQIPHISTYSLIIEDHTLLKNQKVEAISEDLDASMYSLITDKLREYHHYEISNFAKKGFESQHNLTYWNNLEYYGFGLGASGYIKGVRYTNTRSITNYQLGNRRYEEDTLSIQEKMENEFLLGLRKTEGVCLTTFQLRFYKDPLQSNTVQSLLEKKLLVVDGEYLKIPEEYLYISNEILLHFINWEEDF